MASGISLNFPSSNNPIRVKSTDEYWVHTDSGPLLELMCGNTAFIFGFNNQQIIHAVQQQQQNLSYLLHTEYTSDDNDKLIDLLCGHGKFSGLAWAISGSDGVECATAMNDRYWKEKNPKKTKIVSFAPGYHGITYLARAMRGLESLDSVVVTLAPKWQKLQYRHLYENYCFNLISDLLKNNDDIGAVIMESIPWASGLKPWSNKWWTDIRTLCTELGVNLIIDDVMGGVGKLGAVFSHTLYNIQPDIAVLGKSLTGGYSPLSCACASQEITDVIKNNWEYGHTWQPNMAGVAAALTSLELLDLDRIPKIQNNLYALGVKLKTLGYVTEIVSQGLLCEYILTEKHYITKNKLYASGLSSNYLNNKIVSITVCAPIIAEDEYFQELEFRLIEALT
jgi:adenosylmethionine-8-amino-7-oxononanoate aminotransferase